MKQIIVQIPDETIEKYGMSQIYNMFNNLYIDYGIQYRTLDENENINI